MKHNKMPKAIAQAISNITREQDRINAVYTRIKACLPLIEQGLNTQGLTVSRCYLPDQEGYVKVEALPIKRGKFKYLVHPQFVGVSMASRKYQAAVREHQDEITELGARIEDSILNLVARDVDVSVNEHSLEVPPGMKKGYQKNIMLDIQL